MNIYVRYSLSCNDSMISLTVTLHCYAWLNQLVQTAKEWVSPHKRQIGIIAKCAHVFADDCSQFKRDESEIPSSG